MKKFNKLLFGVAGVPLASEKRTILEGVKKVKELNLDAMELEFVRRVNVTVDKAIDIRVVSKRENIALTSHAPYYINFNSFENEKLKMSKKRLLETCKITYFCGGWSVCFHAAYYMNKPVNEVYSKVKNALKELMEELMTQKYIVWVRPETTGKPSQFGSLEELIKLSLEVENVLPVIDFAHLHARAKGGNNSYEEFCSILSLIEKELSVEALKNMHIHVSGIEYGEKGEKRHLNLLNSDFNYKDLIKALKRFEVKGVLICESQIRRRTPYS